MNSLDLRYHGRTMRVFFQLLLWLSITALSLLGSAAVAAGQADGAAFETVLTAGQQHHQAAGQGGGEHCAKPGSTSAASLHAKCPACASCCVGAAAPPTLPLTFQAPLLASSRHAVPEAAMTSFVPSALERPPRGFLV
jgi:hypothetical protein